MYPILVTVSLLLVAGSSIYMSVYGLMAVFASNATVIICMGLGMEIGKILTVAHLYRNWPNLRRLARSLYILIVSVLVLLTSIEVIGFLSLSHANAIQTLRATQTALKGLQKEAAILKEQLGTLDATLAGLPASYVTRRIKERQSSGYPQKQARLLEIAKQQAEIETRLIQDQTNSGPIYAVARILKINETDAIAMLILILVSVLEPLSIGLTLATSAAWATRKTSLNQCPPQSSQGTGTGQELAPIVRQYNLSIAQLASITGRKKAKTCEAWLDGTTPVPAKALQAVRTWTHKQGSQLTPIQREQSEKPKPTSKPGGETR